VFLSKGISKTRYKVFGKSPCQKLFYKKVEREKTSLLSFYPFDFFKSRFLAVSLHEELKHTTKIRPEIIKPGYLKNKNKSDPGPRTAFLFLRGTGQVLVARRKGRLSPGGCLGVIIVQPSYHALHM
jgi:hypothetical protein